MDNNNGNELTLSEQEALLHYEEIIERGLTTFVEVGSALLAIKDNCLYRASHGTWEDYCRERWGIGSKYAYRLIQSAEVFGNLSPIGDKSEHLRNRMFVNNPATWPPGFQLPTTESQVRPLSPLAPEQQRDAWTLAVENAAEGKVTAKHVEEAVAIVTGKANHQLINQSTNNEWYTPPQYIEAVHEVMGGIDLDPASCAAANKTVRAIRFYTIDDDGFAKPWPGRVFLNPPYGRDDSEGSNQARWSACLIDQFHSHITTEAILLVNAVPSNKWFVPLWEFPICFTDHRIRFYDENDEFGHPTHSNCFVYLGPQVDRFASVFSRFGVIAVRYQIGQGLPEVALVET